MDKFQHWIQEVYDIYYVTYEETSDTDSWGVCTSDLNNLRRGKQQKTD